MAVIYPKSQAQQGALPKNGSNSGSGATELMAETGQRIESPKPGGESLHHRPDVDGLRAVAVLSVVAFHASTRFPGGFVGVDVFFVISGYLISSIILGELKRGRFSFSDFYARRIRRIFPALVLVLAASWLLGWFVLEPEGYALLGKHMIGGAAFFSNILLWSEAGYFDPSAASKPLLHLWSLGIEEQFYLIWPAFLLLAWKFGRRVHLWILLLLGASFFMNVASVRADPIATFYLPFSRFWELLVGAMLAYVNLNHPEALSACRSISILSFRRSEVSVQDVAALLGLALIVAGVFVLSEASSFPGWWALMPTIGAVLLIAAGPGGWINRSLLSGRWMTSIGLISYPLYLWHWPLLSLGRSTAIGIEHPRLTTVTMVGLSFVLSFLTYQFVEKRLRYGLNLSNRVAVPGLLGALAILTVVAGMTIQGGGWSGRYPEAMRPYLDYKYDYKESFRNHRCLLAGSETEFAAECAGSPQAKSLMLIWGDSHGAMLYRALSEAGQPKGISVAQFTSSSCPPVLDFDKKYRPLCRTINDDIFRKITQLRPATVVLAHDWPQSVQEGSLAKLAETVKRLRKAGVSKIVLVGPVPHWGKALHTEMVRFMRTNGSSAAPQRMISGVTEESIQALDEKLALLAKSLSIDYVSSYRSFCNLKGCLVTVGADGFKDLTAFDESHLTAAAARFLVSESERTFFAKID
jgi:peptidoglycan/LPS O-acetylase OafA/YrhL